MRSNNNNKIEHPPSSVGEVHSNKATFEEVDFAVGEDNLESYVQVKIKTSDDWGPLPLKLELLN